MVYSIDSLMKIIQEDIKDYPDGREIVEADVIEMLTIKEVPVDQLHPNPKDEFCNPTVGPSEGIVEEYIEEAVSDMKAGVASFDMPIMVSKTKPDGYVIINGHHRWAAAVKVRLNQVRIIIVNPGWENVVTHFL